MHGLAWACVEEYKKIPAKVAGIFYDRKDIFFSGYHGGLSL